MVDFIFLTETWITEDHHLTEFAIQGYQKPIASFKVRGGTCIYVKSGIHANEITPPGKFQDSSWVETITVNGIKRIYGCIYRSPNSKADENLKLLENVSWAKKNYTEVVLVGDFNLPSIDWDTEAATGIFPHLFMECCSENCLEQLIDKPTRHREGQQSSLLDLILTNEPDCITEIQHQAPFGKSDHEVIEFAVLNEQNKPAETKHRYDFRKMDLSKFIISMNQTNWLHNIDVQETTDTFDELSSSAKSALDESTPKKKVGNAQRAPWSNREIQKLSRKKRTAWDRYKHSGMQRNSKEGEIYRTTLQDFNQAKRDAVRKYEFEIVKNRGRNPKRYYSYISKKSKYRDTAIALRDEQGVTHVNEETCAIILDKCFGKVFTKGTSKEIPSLRTPRVGTAMPQVHFSEKIVLKKLNSLNIAKATGPDDIPAILLKKASAFFAPILAKLFQKAYDSSDVPLGMKKANITPIHKGGNKKDPNNYRPVSITPIAAKVYEAIIYDSLYEHIATNQVISTYQHGFQKGKSTTTNLIDFWNDITSIADKPEPLSIIYTDLRKAFDTVPHDLLLAKLEHYGIRGKNLNWIRSFLSNRQQRVVLNGHSSPFSDVESGVPQGGILSGLFFILYMNDLPECINNCKVSLYADDAKLYAPVTSLQAISDIQSDINAVVEWCRRWRLNLNPTKCYFIHYNPKNSNINHAPQYFIEETQINRKQKVTDLGLVITEDLKFHSHVDHICKLSKWEISRIRRSFVSRNPQFLTNMFKTFVRPNLEYAVQVWNPSYIEDKKKIERIQNRFTRLLPHGPVMTPEERNQYLKLTDHETRRLRGDLILMYKMISAGELTPKTETRTRGHSKAIEIERARTNLRSHSFHFRNSRTWNSLPEEVVSAKDINEFKTMLDNHWKSCGKTKI